MLDAIYKLGKLYIEKDGLDEIEVLLDNKSNISKVLVINLSQNENGQLNYENVYQEDFQPDKQLKYLYKKGSSNGPNITPSSLITEVDKTFNKKFIKWFEKYNKNELYKQLGNLFSDRKEDIQKDLEEIHKNLNLNKNENVLLTFVITKDDEKKYIGDIEDFIISLRENSAKKFHKGKIKGNGNCYLCGEDKEVCGLVSSAVGFAFSTSEKEGNVPGLSEKNQWKLLPICEDCGLYLQAGKDFIEKYLDFKEFGLSYYVIPNFLFDSKKGFNILFTLLQNQEQEHSSKELEEIENKLTLLVKSIDDILEFKFLFYKKNNNAFNILSFVESVIPSWLNKFYNSQFEISDYDIFLEPYLKKNLNKNIEGNFIDYLNSIDKYYKCSYSNWCFKILRDFLYSFSPKAYLDTVSDILSNNKLDFNFLLARMMDKLRSNWRNEENSALKTNVLKSLMLFILFDKLNLIKGVDKMNLSENNELNLDNFLNMPDKKASFLLGVLTRKLLNIQYRELGSTPFYNKLWGLSLDKKKIIKLYPMVINKLREYNSAYVDLEKEISENLNQATDNWKLNRDETSYYFVLGFTQPNINLNENEGDIDE